MIKEEILKANTPFGGLEFKTWIEQGVLKSMDEYAKSVAIEFVKWAYNKAVRNGYDDWTVGVGISVAHFTTDQLFQLFIDQRNKQ